MKRVLIWNPNYSGPGDIAWIQSRDEYYEYETTAIQKGIDSYDPDRGVTLTLYVAANGDVTTDVGKYEETHP